jgi:lipoyl(octanoyl) transferase
VIIKRPGLTDYDASYDAMRRFTDERGSATPDELWLTQHPPIYTVGIAGRSEHFPRASGSAGIPLKRIDRGGQITYHGPGQAIAYVLLDLARRGLKVRELIAKLEQAVIELLATCNVKAARRPGAPGVYVEGAKLAALGLRVRRGCCYHGLALNVDMDLSPFHTIDPCGYPGLLVTQTRALGIPAGVEAMSERLGQAIIDQLDA